MPPKTRGLAIHIGADVLTVPQHAHWPAVRSCRDTMERTSRLASAAGITQHRRLLGARATRAEVIDALRRAAAELDPRGHLLLAFAGHSDRERASEDAPPKVAWCLHDGTLPLAEVAALLAAIPPTALVTVIADTCYAAALSGFTIPATVALLAACGADQQILANPATGFAARLEQLVLRDGKPNPACTSYRWLNWQLRQDSPDVERPRVWTNSLSAWSQRPFHHPAGPQRPAGQPAGAGKGRP
jgi:Caspase domain